MNIESILAELETVHAARVAREDLAVDEALDQQLYDQHWRLLEKIDALPARTIAELAAKARAAQIAVAWDTGIECDGSGSYVGLTRSMIADIFAMNKGS